MKRFALLLPAVLLSACLSLTTTEKQAMSPLYHVESKSYQDIRGNFTVDSFLLYKKISWGSNEAFTINKWIRSDGIYFTAESRFIGPDWRFMDSIHLKTDDDLFSYEDNDPHREVLSGGNVEESVRAILDERCLASLHSTSSLQIQFYAGPIAIPLEGLIALRAFLRQ
jgi:hypothetical protein